MSATSSPYWAGVSTEESPARIWEKNGLARLGTSTMTDPVRWRRRLEAVALTR